MNVCGMCVNRCMTTQMVMTIIIYTLHPFEKATLVHVTINYVTKSYYTVDLSFIALLFHMSVYMATHTHHVTGEQCIYTHYFCTLHSELGEHSDILLQMLIILQLNF